MIKKKQPAKKEIAGAGAGISGSKQTEHDLAERIKELQAFYKLSKLVERKDITLDELYQKIANILPESWQYPEITYARIVIGNSEFRTKNFMKSKYKQSAPVKVNRSIVGKIDVGYLEERSEKDEGPFLKEERLLIDSIAERLGHITEHKQAEAALKESEERYQRITEGLTDYLYTVRLQDGQVVETTHGHACKKVTGYTKKEFADNPNLWMNMVVEEERGQVLESVQKILAGENIPPIEHRIVRKDGQIRWVRDTPILQFDSQSRLVSYDGVIKDITAHKQAEETLAREKLFTESLLATAQTIILVLDTSGHIVTFNPYMEHVSGYKLEEVKGKEWFSTFLPEDKQAKTRDLFLKAIGDIKTKGNIDEIITRDGRIRIIEWYDKTLKDNNGHIVGLLSNGQDITERKQAEKALRESEEKYRTVVENAQEAIYIAVDGILKFGNSKAAELSGYTQEDLTSTPFVEFIHPDDSEMVIDRYLRRLKGEDIPNKYSFRIIDKQGTIRWVELTAVIITWEGKPASLSFLTDITDRKRLEEERQRVEKLESVGMLAGGIAHDFNNILTSILGNISLARTEAAPGSELLDSLEQAEKASLRAKDLTLQLLTFSRGGAPVTKLASLTELLRDTAGFALRGSNVKCHFSIPAGLRHAEVDAGQVSQVIHNLVINAQQAMPAGGSIEIGAENIALSEMQSLGRGLPVIAGDYIRIAVADHGTGIPKEHLDRIFDPFFSTKQKGSGLGLATSFSIARNHGGHISVESELGSGSTFYLYLPASTETVTPEKAEKKATKPAGKARILVMDDEKEVREVAGRMLKHIGYKDIEFAKDGAEAIKLYKAAMESGKPFSVAILDLTIAGGMGGEVAIKKLLKIDPGVKAIVSSGYVDDSVIAKYKKHGFSGMVAKPYTLEQLGKALQDVIG